MKTSNLKKWEFLAVLLALPLQFIATIAFALAFSVPEWFRLQTAMLVVLPALVAATAALSALALRRIGKPLNWAFSVFLFPPLPALIYAKASMTGALAGSRRRSGAMAEMEPAR